MFKNAGLPAPLDGWRERPYHMVGAPAIATLEGCDYGAAGEACSRSVLRLPPAFSIAAAALLDAAATSK